MGLYSSQKHPCATLFLDKGLNTVEAFPQRGAGLPAVCERLGHSLVRVAVASATKKRIIDQPDFRAYEPEGVAAARRAQ